MSVSYVNYRNCFHKMGWTLTVMPLNSYQQPLSWSAADILGDIFNQMQFCNPRKRWTYGQKLLPWWTLEKNRLTSLAVFIGHCSHDWLRHEVISGDPSTWRHSSIFPLRHGLTDCRFTEDGAIALGRDLRRSRDK